MARQPTHKPTRNAPTSAEMRGGDPAPEPTEPAPAAEQAKSIPIVDAAPPVAVEIHHLQLVEGAWPRFGLDRARVGEFAQLYDDQSEGDRLPPLIAVGVW